MAGIYHKLAQDASGIESQEKQTGHPHDKLLFPGLLFFLHLIPPYFL